MSASTPSPAATPQAGPGAGVRFVDEPGPWRRSPIRKFVLAGAGIAFVAFWVWALFFASKESVNKIGDREWAARAEEICARYDAQLVILDRREEADPVLRSELVVESTDLLAAMLDELMAVPPTDDKGAAIVPLWEADYRTLLDDRYRYAERLRSGQNVPFTETAVDGVPITERIETFAAENEMKSCSPPRGSVV